MKKVNYFLALALVLVFAVSASAQRGLGFKKATKDTPITKVEFQKAVRDYVNAEKKENKGIFVVKDQETGKNIEMNLMKVHNKDLSYLGNDTYFICSDFRGNDGKIYDVDIFMKGTNAKDLTMEKINIHKVDGVERYQWKEVVIYEMEEIERPEKIKEKAIKDKEEPKAVQQAKKLDRMSDEGVRKVPERPAKRQEYE